MIIIAITHQEHPPKLYTEIDKNRGETTKYHFNFCNNSSAVHICHLKSIQYHYYVPNSTGSVMWCT